MGKSGIDFLDALADFATSYITPQKIDVLADMMLYVLQVVAWMAYQIAPALVVAAEIFSEHAKGTFDFLKTAVDVLNAIAKNAMPNEAQIQAFVDALPRTLALVSDAVGISAAIANNTAATSANMATANAGAFAIYTLPDIIATRPTPPPGGWPSLPGRPGTGGGGGGGGGRKRRGHG